MAEQVLSNEADESSLSSILNNPNSLSKPVDSHGVLYVSQQSVSSPISTSANTVLVQQASFTADEQTGMFVEDNHNSLDVKSSYPQEETDTSHFLFPLTPLQRPGALSNAITSNNPHNPRGAFETTPEQASPSGLFLMTPSSSGITKLLPDNEIHRIANSSLSLSDNAASETSETVVLASTAESQQIVADCYTNLTSWTTKLITQGLGQLPLPNKESLPIPLFDDSHQLSVPASSVPLYSKPDSSTGSFFPVYSKVGPIPSQHDETVGPAASVDTSAITPSLIKVSSVHKPKFKSSPNKEHRFKRTADALHKSGLWEVAMKTGNLIKRNQELQKELEQFRADALFFLKSVIKNPQNRDFIKTVLNNALQANSSCQQKTSVMSAIVTAAAAASLKAKSVSSTHDSGMSSSGSQSDQSVSNFSCTGTLLETNSPGSTNKIAMDIE